jgi:TfoX/Sxy family transcriptional regulator of competence genes
VAAKKKAAMPKWQHAPQEWIDAFDAALPKDVERRKMFGYPAAFVNGNMAAGLYRDDLVLKLDEKDRDALLKAGGKPFVVMGRTMGAFVAVPPNFKQKPADLKKWLARSIAFAASLPPKVKKKKTKRED